MTFLRVLGHAWGRRVDQTVKPPAVSASTPSFRIVKTSLCPEPAVLVVHLRWAPTRSANNPVRPTTSLAPAPAAGLRQRTAPAAVRTTTRPRLSTVAT